jgi:hypothetical protein
MAFSIEAFQNRYLSAGQRRVDGILTVTASGDPAVATRAAPLVLGFILDRSGSMAGERLAAAVGAVTRAISILDERAWMFVVAFDARAELIVPECQATPENKAKAEKALRTITAGGGTAMSTGLTLTRSVFQRAPDAIRQAVFLTDGKNESEASSAVSVALGRCEGLFQCDCWGVGTDWQVGEVQQISTTLLGKASLIPEPAGVERAFRAAIEKANAKSLKDVRLRLWTPQGTSVVFVKQVSPTLDDLGGRARTVSPQIREFLTGAWSPGESRDYHVALEVRAGAPGEEMLACRSSLAWLEPEGGTWVEKEDKPATGRIFASWSDDANLTSRIDEHVAHYTNQNELAGAIQRGLDARAKGDDAGATQLLGRAVQLAHAAHDAEMTQRLAKVVDVVDAGTGTVRLRREVQKAAAMDLELESRTTKRAKKS